MNFLKDLLIFDTETTGLEPSKDQIIELCVQFGMNESSEQKIWRFKPDVPISQESQAVHGITLEDLSNCPKFRDQASEIFNIFSNAKYLVGYNVLFDLNFLQEEFRRSQQTLLDLSKIHLIDPSVLWRKMEPRSLSAAHERFVGVPLVSAHSASVDVRGTGTVLSKMIEQFKLSNEDDIIKKSSPISPSWIGPSNHFLWRGGNPVFGFGKHKNRIIFDVAKEDGGSYMSWLSGSDFPIHVKQIAKEAPKLDPDQFRNWLIKKFGGPANRENSND